MQADYAELLAKSEPLLPELAAYYEEGDLPMVRHPFCYSVPHSQQMNALTNHRFRLMKEEIEDALAEEQFSRYIFLHERPYRLNAFLEVADKLPCDEFSRLLASIYTDSENIWQNEDTWRGLLARGIDQSVSMTDSEQQALAALPDEITVYRGYAERGTAEGFSWTTDYDKACWFAKRLAQAGDACFVAEATIPKNDVIWYFEGRGESEIVVASPEKYRIGFEGLE